MKHSEKSIRKLLPKWADQPHCNRVLITYFVLAALVPSFILVFTEGYSFLHVVSALLLPAGFYTLWSVASRRSGAMVLWGLIWLILAAFQLVLLYMFGNSIIAVDMFTNLFTTNPSEAGELLNNILPILAVVCVIYVPLIVLAVIALRRKHTLERPLRRRVAWIGAAMLVAGCATVQFDVFPFNVLQNIYLSLDELHRVRHYPETSRDFTYDASRTADAPGREIYVMVIGEAARADNWQLYGYGRETNPLLAHKKNLVVYKNVVTQSNATHKSVPMILSSASAMNHDEIYRRKGIVQLYKDMGFRTLVVSCQAPNRGLIQMMTEESDSVIYLNHKYDGEMLDHLITAIEADTSDLFVVLHSYGSHFNYRERYPDTFSKFTPDNDVSISKQNKQRMVNAYDNSILYTDWFLSSLIDILNESGACTAMFYCADHGEDLFDDHRGRFLHSSPTITYYQAHVACVGWFSDRWRVAYPQAAAAAESNTMAPATTHSVFHTVAQMAAIESPYVDATVSLLSPDFDYAAHRYYLDDHCDAMKYGDMGFIDEDWEQFARHGISDLE